MYFPEEVVKLKHPTNIADVQSLDCKQNTSKTLLTKSNEEIIKILPAESSKIIRPNIDSNALNKTRPLPEENNEAGGFFGGARREFPRSLAGLAGLAKSAFFFNIK